MDVLIGLFVGALACYSLMKLRDGRINKGSYEELWRTSQGELIPIGRMRRSHLVHALALIMRKSRFGYIWKRDCTGQLRYHSPAADAEFFAWLKRAAPILLSEWERVYAASR